MKQIGQPPAGAGNKAPIRNPLEELSELVKDAGEQAGVKPAGSEQPQAVPQPEVPLPQPSVLEKRRPSQLAAIEHEIKELRTRREQSAQQTEVVEERQEEQIKEEKKKSWREKGLEFIKKRAMHKIEGRQQRAA